MCKSLDSRACAYTIFILSIAISLRALTHTHLRNIVQHFQYFHSQLSQQLYQAVDAECKSHPVFFFHCLPKHIIYRQSDTLWNRLYAQISEPNQEILHCRMLNRFLFRTILTIPLSNLCWMFWGQKRATATGFGWSVNEKICHILWDTAIDFGVSSIKSQHHSTQQQALQPLWPSVWKMNMILLVVKCGNIILLIRYTGKTSNFATSSAVISDLWAKHQMINHLYRHLAIPFSVSRENYLL